MNNICVEEWRTISGFPDYDVSNLGRVRSWRGNGNGTRSKTPKILKSQIGTNGRPKYELSDGRRNTAGVTRSTTRYEHKLVSQEFIGPCPDGHEVRHIDGNVLNNKVENLTYGTHVENISDKRRHGTMHVGSRSNFSKLTEEDVLEIRSSGLPPKQLARKYSVSRDTVYLILNRKTWRHV